MASSCCPEERAFSDPAENRNAGAGCVIDQLLSKHERQILRFLAQRSGPLVLKRATLDDLCQETAAAAIASAHTVSFENDAHFISWIYTIARRIINLKLTRQVRTPKSVRLRHAQSSGIGVPESQLVSGCRTPLSSAAGRERNVRLRDAIEQLPDHYRRVITLYKLDELPLTDVAERLGKTKGATCRLVARAMNQLRTTLGEQ